MSAAFATTNTVLQLVTFLLSFVFAGIVVGCVALGLYLLFAPGDTLVVVYQNYHLRRSMRPLKDEDFKSPKIIILRLRSLGALCLGFAVVMVFFMLRSMNAGA